MKKRIISLLLVLVMCLGLLPAAALAAPAEPDTEGKLDQAVYDQLGFSTGMTDAQKKGEALDAPYSEDHSTQLYTAREIYVAGNGANANKYTVRNGFDRMDARGEHPIGEERFRGAYEYYALQEKGDLSKNDGYSIDSNLSSNSANSMKKDGNGFSGIYATSVAFDAGDGQDNYIAELRAYGDKTTTTINGNDYKGGLSIEIFRVDEMGNRSRLQSLTPEIVETMGYTNEGGERHMRYMTRHYVQELDATFEIQAADMNGDGKDELYVYSGRFWGDDKEGENEHRRLAYIDVFEQTSGSSYTKTDEIAVDAGRDGPDYVHFSSGNWETQICAIPVVSMSVGDLDRDHKEELAVAVSSPNADWYQKTSMAAHTVVFSGSGHEQILDIPLNNGKPYLDVNTGYRGVSAASCTFGTFALPGTSMAATVLIMAGHASSPYCESMSAFSNREIGYRYVYLNQENGKYSISDFAIHDPGSASNHNRIWQSFKTDELIEHDNNVVNFSEPVYAPTAMACANMAGTLDENGTFNEQLFLDGDIYEFVIGQGIMQSVGQVALTDQQRNTNSGKDKNKGQIWISSVQAGIIDTDAKGNHYRESFIYTSGAHRLKPVNDDDDYYWMDVGAAWMEGEPGNWKLCSEQEGAIAQSNSRNDEFGTFLSICLPDIDHDTLSLTFDYKTTVFTEPEVYAVLQASPYFADLATVEGYLGNGGTSFSTSKTSSHEGSTSLSQTLGVGYSINVSFFVDIDISQTINATASYECCTNREMEYSISYNSQAGNSDHVVVYTVPYEYYFYNTYDPLIGEHGRMIVPVALTPVQTTMTVERYDEIAAVTEGLEVVRDNILHNTPGCPETYHGDELGGELEFEFKDYSMANSGGAGSDITQTISKTTGTSHAFQVGTSISTEVGGGVGIAGNSVDMTAISETEAGFGYTYSSTSGTEFSGTVDALPEDAKNFSFSWKLMVNRAPISKDEKEKEKVWVVGYDVVSVYQPPRMPQDLRVTEVGMHHIDLAWDSNGGTAAYYNLYRVDELGKLIKENDQPIPYGQTTYHVDRLIPNREYTFCIEAVDAKGEKSIMSPQVAATTLPSDIIITILKQPQDWKGEKNQNASFETDASLVMEEENVPLLYQWQIKRVGENIWTDLTEGAPYTGVKTKVLQVHTADAMSGDQVRCKIYVHNRPIMGYTNAALLTVGDLHHYAMSFGGTVQHGLTFNDYVGTVTAACGGQSLDNGGLAKELSQVTFTATVKPGYAIAGWLRNAAAIPADQIVVAEDGTQTFTIDSVSKAEEINVQYIKYPVLSWNTPNNGTLTAKGTPLDQTEEQTLTASPVTLAYGSKVTLTASPAANYIVDQWTVNGKPQQQKGDVLVLDAVQEDTTVAVTFKEGKSYTASFTGSLEDGTFTEEAAALTMRTDGTVTTGKVYEEHSVTFEAVPGEGYIITGWTLDGQTVEAVVNEDGSQSVTVDKMTDDTHAEVTLKALTAKTTVKTGPNGQLVSVKAGSLDLTAKAETGMEIRENVPVTITVAPDTGYEVQTWIVNRLAVPNQFENTYSYVADAFGAEIEIRFRPAAYTVRWEQAAVENHSSGDAFRGGTQLTLTAETVRGKELTGWMVNGQLLENETAAALTWTVPLGAPNDTVYEIKPVYKTLQYEITVQQPAEGSITGENLVNNVVSLDAGSSYALTAQEVPGLFISRWVLDGQTVERGQTGAAISADGNTLTLSSIYADHTVTAVYDSVTVFTVTWTLVDETPEPIAQISTEDLIVKTGSQSVARGAEVESGKAIGFAVPAVSEYHAVKWTVNGQEVPGGVMNYNHPHLTEDLEVVVTVLDEAAIKYQVAVEEGITHGTVTPSTSEQRKNNPVSVTVDPEEHYHLKELTVLAGETSVALTGTDDPNVFTFQMPQHDVIVHAVFEEDPKAIVTFQVEHGTWADHTAAPQTVTVWLDRETGEGSLPNTVIPNGMLADDHYEAGGWEPAITGTVTENITYTYKFVPKIETVNVTFKVKNGTWSDSTTADKQVSVTLTGGFGTLAAGDVPTGMIANEGYENGQWDITPNTAENGITGVTTYTFAFEEHVPVETTAEVTFRVVHGTWEDGTDEDIVVEVTLYDGVGTLEQDLVPTGMKANGGYENGHWREKPDTDEDALTGDVRYTYVFDEIEEWDDDRDERPDPVKPGGGFDDVKEDDYFFEPVEWAVEEEITSGMDATHFAPDAVCTRAQAVTFLWRAAGRPDPKSGHNPFNDVSRSDYFYDAVLWAVEKGITKGTSDTTFSPEQSCTRAQIVTFLWRSERMPQAGSYNPFHDVKESDYFADAVLWAVEEEITKGTSDTTFSPDLACTRAQIVTFLYRNR